MLRIALLLAVSVLTVLGTSCVAPSAQAQSHLEHLQTVAYSGQQVPIGPPGSPIFGNLGGGGCLWNPVINSQGQIAFAARLAGSGVSDSDDECMLLWDDGTFGSIFRDGQPAPDTTPGSVFSFWTSPRVVLNDGGRVAFTARLDDHHGDDVLWSSAGSGLHLVAREGSEAPGLAEGVRFSWNNYPETITMNSAGQTAFFQTLVGLGISESNNGTIWREQTGALRLVAREGEAVAGEATDVTFGGMWSPRLNAAGEIAFCSLVQGPGIDSSNEGRIFVASDEDLRTVVRQGDQASDCPSGVLFDTLWSGAASVSFNDAGETTFVANLTGAGVNNSNNRGVWSEGGDGLHMIGRAGDVAPDLPDDTKFGGFSASLINHAGDVAFTAWLTGLDVDQSNNTGIWLEKDGETHLIAREGSPAPDMPAGVVFGDLGDFVINSTAQVAFEAGLRGPDSSHGSLWALDRMGDLQLIAEAGDQIELAPSLTRSIKTPEIVGGSGGGDGLPASFNDRGELVFLAYVQPYFEQVILVSDLPTVPEPSTLVLLTMGTVGLLAYGWRRRRQAA